MTQPIEGPHTPGQQLLDHLNELRRGLETCFDAFDALYYYVRQLQARQQAKGRHANEARVHE
jgi:hypothetical protein